MSDAAATNARRLDHETTCAYHGLPFVAGSGNKICCCPGRIVTPTSDAAR